MLHDQAVGRIDQRFGQQLLISEIADRGGGDSDFELRLAQRLALLHRQQPREIGRAGFHRIGKREQRVASLVVAGVAPLGERATGAGDGPVELRQIGAGAGRKGCPVAGLTTASVSAPSVSAPSISIFQSIVIPLPGRARSGCFPVGRRSSSGRRRQAPE
jgi:hypothetical protein